MKKNRGIVVGAVILAIIAIGFFFGVRMSAAMERSTQEDGSGVRQTIRTVAVGAGPVLQAMPVGIKNTINLSPAAFVPTGIGQAYQFSYGAGYLIGSAGNPVLCASVVFPKGAKKILHIDFYFQDFAGNSAWTRMIDSHPLYTTTTVLIDFKTAYNNGEFTKYSVTPTSNKIYSDHVYYISLMINGTGTFYGAIVYYSTTL